jgi:hypothetical protein
MLLRRLVAEPRVPVLKYLSRAAQVSCVLDGWSLSSIPSIPIVLIGIVTVVTFSLSDSALQFIYSLFVITPLGIEYLLVLIHFIFIIVPKSFHFLI